MSLNSRLAIRFLLQIGLLLLLFWGIIVVVAIGYVTTRGAHERSLPSAPTVVLQQLPRATTIHQGQVMVSERLLKDIAHNDGWLQVLDANGRAIYNFRRPPNAPVKYTPGRLVYDVSNPQALGYQLATWYKSEDHESLTWLYGLPLARTAGASHKPYRLLAGLALTALLATIFVAFLFGRRMGRPVLHMMTWLKNLAHQSYEEPRDGRGLPKSKTATGELRRPYRVYRDILGALEQLADTLRRNDREHIRLERTREEWITGITHDLRTPLSSVKGYADLLAAPEYDWTNEEIRQYGQVISEQAAYLDGLIEDLGLTFQLRNQALSLHPRPENVVELVRRVVIHLVNYPQSRQQRVRFESSTEEINYPVDAQWFTRALDNLVVNASLHNPEDTTIVVTVQALTGNHDRYPGVRITIQDDGQGMDEETVAHLFDRYYRGTNTSPAQAKGSGLGTAIAHQLIEAHGGHISVQSAIGQGTTLIIHLPSKS